MLERHVLPILLLASVLPAAAGQVSRADLPPTYGPGLDGRIAYAEDRATGAVWAAWAYRTHGEYDIAVSARDLSGVWSEPAFLGRLDGADQTAPTMVFDADGNLYLAFSVRQTARVFLSILPRDGAAFWNPSPVTPDGERASAPTLAVTSDSLVLAYRTHEGRVAVRLLPLLSQINQIRGIYDNPDGTDPLGVTSPGAIRSPSSGNGGVSVPLREGSSN
jgi:hypothetical protein